MSRSSTALKRLDTLLERDGFTYAVTGDLAVAAHGLERRTGELELLLTSDGIEAFRRLFVPKHYRPVEGRPRRFIDQANELTIEIRVTGLHPGYGPGGLLTYPDPANVRERIDSIWYVNLSTLIELKLANRRSADSADVVSLAARHNLDESYQARLHPAVRRGFASCIEEIHREMEFLACNS